MKHKSRLITLLAVGFIVFFWQLDLSHGISAQASSVAALDHAFYSQFDDSVPCVALTKEAAAWAGIIWDEYRIISQSAGSCTVGFYQGSHDNSPKFLLIMPWVLYEPCKLETGWSNAETSLLPFYGYEAMGYRVLTTGVAEGEVRGIVWCMPVGENPYRFKIETTSISVAEYGPADDPMPVAEAIYSLAESYLGGHHAGGDQSQPEEPNDGFNVPPDVTDISQDEQAGQPPTEDELGTPPTDGELDTPPTIVVVGSIAIPLLGALLGAFIASLTSAWGSAATSTVTAGVTAAAVQNVGVSSLSRATSQATGIASPVDAISTQGGVREPPEPASQIFQPGDCWRGHQIDPEQPNPAQLRGSEQPVDRETLRREEQPSPQVKDEKLPSDTNQPEIRPLEMRFVDFQEEIYRYRDELERKYYVANPWQGDPTMVVHRARCVSNIVYDKTIGKFTGKQGLTCSEYVEKTANRVAESLKKHIPDAQLESVVFDERSSLSDANKWKDWLDSTVEDNHNLLRVTLPDGTEWAVDFHQNRAGNSPLFRKFTEAREEWKEYIGKQEFVERVSFTLLENKKVK